MFATRGTRAGETKYHLSKLILLTLDAITGFSTFPLRLVSMMGCGHAVQRGRNHLGSLSPAVWRLGDSRLRASRHRHVLFGWGSDPDAGRDR